MAAGRDALGRRAADAGHGPRAVEIIREINRQGITVLLIEQNANMALKIADWAYVMQTGSILMQGPGEELAANEEVKAAYLGTAK